MDEGTPICCGFFVSPTIGITVNHVSWTAVSEEGKLIAMSSRVGEGIEGIVFSVVSRHPTKDFMVLRTFGEQTQHAFFPISTAQSDYRPGRRLALVTMSIGQGAARRHAPVVGVAAVVVKRCDIKNSRLFYESATWEGDSGAAALVENGAVVAMHLGVSSEPLSPASPVADTPAVLAHAEDGASSAHGHVFAAAATAYTAFRQSGLEGKESYALMLTAAVASLPVSL